MPTGLSWLQRHNLGCNLNFLFATHSKWIGGAHCHGYMASRTTRAVLVSRHYLHTSAKHCLEESYSSEPLPFVNSSRYGTTPDIGPPLKPRPSKVPRVPPNELRNPDAWIALLDPYLPTILRSTAAAEEECEKVEDKDECQTCQDIIAILDSARKDQHAGVEILAHMVIHNRKRAALHIVDKLLNDIAFRYPIRTSSRPPSNIQWPGKTMNDICKHPINIKKSSVRLPQVGFGFHEQVEDPRYSFILSEKKETAMTEIWSMLGALVARAADLPEIRAEDANNAALLVLGQIHNLDLVPESVYSYRQSSLATTVQRPPILHLVSSRILAAISDATWRQHQDKMIENAASHGIPYDKIGRNPPGGRFRLKVRPLGPEIWLEFILWCCVEGGFSTAGSRIIRSLQARADDPWFAVTWSNNGRSSQTSPVVDWQRVRARYGGSVGIQEGYSGDKPFVEMPSRTISTEVVLALVESSVNSINHVAIQPNFLQTVQRNIYELLAFLEPHDLPTNYFNYVAVRLMQTDVFVLPQYSHTLQTWYKRVASMKTLKFAQPFPELAPSLNLDSISAYSEAFTGILHQALDGCVQSGDIHRALDIFNDLQQLVDLSKLQAIGAFLHGTASQNGTARAVPDTIPEGSLEEFVGSHGQLPLYKLTGLLDLATDTGLTGFNEWLLYSDDPDGPLIPRSAYENPSLARALLRFASSNEDDRLLKELLRAQQKSRRLASVNFLRTMIDTNITLLHFETARTYLSRLSSAQGGGLGLTNVAQLAAVILKLESSNSYELMAAERTGALTRGRQLLEQMLDGKFNNRTGTFQATVRRSFRQQIGSLLQVFRIYPRSMLSDIGTKYGSQYPVANKAELAPMIFNYLMDAVVQCQGSVEGMRLWNLCCQFTERTESYSSHELLLNDEHGASNIKNQITDDWSQTDNVPAPSTIEQPYQEHGQDDIALRSVTGITPPTTDIGLPRIDTLGTSNFEDSFFPSIKSTSSSPASEPSRLVVPSQQTLRLIVRGAVRERQEALRFKKSIDVQKSVLSWAAEQLRRFGATSRMISMELEEPVKQSQIRKLDEQRYTSKHRPQTPAPNVRRVSSSFAGQAQTRVHSRRRNS